MEQSTSYDETECTRRYQLSTEAFDAPAVVVAMARRVAEARRHADAGGLIIEHGRGLSSARRVGLLASSMNPLTCAHVALADAARRFARLDALCWVATLVTIDKESVERATLIDRLIEGQMHARASGEGLLLLSGGLYVEQARAAHALLEPEVEISLIVGYDKVVQIFDRRYYTDRDAALSELFAEAALIVAPRDGASEADLHTLLSAPENRPFADRVSYCPLPDRFARDSSSEARALASTGEIGGPLRDLLTPEGLALTVTAQPYEPPREPSTTSLGDRYTARQIILAALSRLDEPQLAVTPKLSDLVAWSAENSGRGAALRAWALDSASDNRGLRAALEMR